MMTTVEARENFAEVINRTAYGKERVVLTRRGKPLAAVVSMEDVQLLEQVEHTIEVREAQVALQEIRKYGTIALRDFMKERGL